MARKGFLSWVYFLTVYPRIAGRAEIELRETGREPGCERRKVESGADLEAALKRGIKATRDGKPYLVEVATAPYGGGAESTWHEKFNLAEKRKRQM